MPNPHGLGVLAGSRGLAALQRVGGHQGRGSANGRSSRRSGGWERMFGVLDNTWRDGPRWDPSMPSSPPHPAAPGSMVRRYHGAIIGEHPGTSGVLAAARAWSMPVVAVPDRQRPPWERASTQQNCMWKSCVCVCDPCCMAGSLRCLVATCTGRYRTHAAGPPVGIPAWVATGDIVSVALKLSKSDWDVPGLRTSEGFYLLVRPAERECVFARPLSKVL